MDNCKYCGRPLNESQYNQDKTLKSCPKCSVIDGEEHIFLSYPDSFGVTEKRISSKNLDGTQSYCQPHRAKSDNRIITKNGIRCSYVKGNNV